VNSLDSYSYSLIGRLTDFLQFQEFRLCKKLIGRAVFSSTLKAKVGRTLVKTEVLRILLNVDRVLITSKRHTHPSHSQTSRLLNSTLS
jgi:hypothetical protein